MHMTRKNSFIYGAGAVFLLAALGTCRVPDAYAAEMNDAYVYGSAAACGYYLDNAMLTYQRDFPISMDDPASEELDDNAVIAYQYGYVFSDVNDYYFYNRAINEWEGKEPMMDTGVLIGGNAYSKHDATELDDDSNDFNGILPYASIFIEPDKLNYETGTIEYEFFTDDFKFNESTGELPANITILGEDNKTDLTTYQLRYPDLSYPKKHDSRYPVNWRGVVYTGGIQKTRTPVNGRTKETIVENDDPDEDRLFTVRYKDAAVDALGNQFDLVLSFKRIAFVAEADVDGALAILEANKLYVAPILYKDGEYTIVIDDPTNEVDVHDQNGVRIGARYELDYSIEDSDGNPADGLLMYSMNDLDNASMAGSLQTDASWGTNALGNDFKWAEGFGIVNGAASHVVMPYFNHEVRDVNGHPINNYNGDTGLIRISRMKGTTPDGTANGLYFTTSITAVSGTGARNDADTSDTGMSMLLYPQGSFVSAISAGRRGDVNITLFDSRVANKIEQSAAGGGRIYSLDHSFKEDGDLVENEDYLKVVGGGTDSTHYMEPEPKHRVYRIQIDGVNVYYRDLKWEEQSDGSFTADYNILDEYGRITMATDYHFHRNNNGLVWVTFDDIQDSHSINVEFVKFGLFGILRSISGRLLAAVFLLAGFSLLVIISCISWMMNGNKRNMGP